MRCLREPHLRVPSPGAAWRACGRLEESWPGAREDLHVVEVPRVSQHAVQPKLRWWPCSRTALCTCFHWTCAPLEACPGRREYAGRPGLGPPGFQGLWARGRQHQKAICHPEGGAGTRRRLVPAGPGQAEACPPRPSPPPSFALWARGAQRPLRSQVLGASSMTHCLLMARTAHPAFLVAARIGHQRSGGSQPEAQRCAPAEHHRHPEHQGGEGGFGVAGHRNT